MSLSDPRVCSIAPRRKLAVFVQIATVMVFASLSGSAQEAQPTPPPTPTPVEPIHTADIFDRATVLRRDLDRMVPSDFDSSLVEATAAELPVIEAELDALRVRLKDAVKEPVSLRVLSDERVEWQLLASRLAALDDGLEREVRDITARRARIEELRAQWRVTLDAAVERGDPPAVTTQVREAVDAISRADTTLDQRLDPILDAQARIGALRRDVVDAVERINQRVTVFGLGLLRPDSPPVWQVLARNAVHPHRHDPLLETARTRLAALRSFAVAATGAIALQVVVWIALGAWLWTVGRQYTASEPDSRSTENVILRAPFTVALLVAVAAGVFLHSAAPRSWREILYLVVIAALARLAVAALPRRNAVAVVALAAVGSVHWFAYVIPDVHPIDRWVWLAVSVLGATVIPAVAKPVLAVFGEGSRLWSSVRSRLVKTVTAALAISAVLNLLGLVDLAVLITGGVMVSLYAAAVLWTLARIVDGIAGLVMRTDWALRSRIIRDHRDRVRAGLRRTIRVVGVAIWVIVCLDAFLLWAPLFSTAQRLMTASLTVGSLTISLGSVLAALVAVWLAVMISRLVQAFFEQEVATRVALPPGVPATMSRLIHYTIIVIGVFLALAAAGIELGQLAIVVGALGVGIGFGLQNIVNNFISGLILMFERPIRIGDVVQLGTLSGIVTGIGIRASRVRTWDGSEVVVPNGNLISTELINWTLSDATRRLEIPVGVAYGSDPERVIELLVAEMSAHERVLPDPEPFALFIGFGDSSLNFSARCWCRYMESLSTSSDLHVAFSRALAAAGIEIPFPQRDLHLRSVEPDAALIRGQAPPATERP